MSTMSHHPDFRRTELEVAAEIIGRLLDSQVIKMTAYNIRQVATVTGISIAAIRYGYEKVRSGVSPVPDASPAMPVIEFPEHYTPARPAIRPLEPAPPAEPATLTSEESDITLGQLQILLYLSRVGKADLGRHTGGGKVVARSALAMQRHGLIDIVARDRERQATLTEQGRQLIERMGIRAA